MYPSAFLFELIGWAYFRVTNYPLQQLVAKKGGGRIFEGGVFSRDYGT